jgi:hypothetical protein
MYSLNDQQIDFILNDIRARGVEMESLQEDLLDHVCCIIERDLEENGDFETFYASTIRQFYRKELVEIEEETLTLLTYKNYYTMKKTMIVSGAISVAGFILGSFFKVMHWPGSAPMILLAIFSASFFFLPLMFILKSKEITQSRDRLIFGGGTLIGIFFCVAVMFMIFHWPGGRVLWLSTLSLAFFVFLPAYFFTGIRKPETKLNTIVSSILLVLMLGSEFMLTNLHKSTQLSLLETYDYFRNQDLLNKMQTNADAKNQTGDARTKLAMEIRDICVQIKTLILQNDIGRADLPADFEAQEIVLYEAGLSGYPEFTNNGKGVQLLMSLKEKVDNYNSTSLAKPADRIPVDHSFLDVLPEKLGLYSNMAVLNGLTRVQMYLAESTKPCVAAR